MHTTKFYLNTNSSFKVISWTRYQTDGQTKLPRLGSIIKLKNYKYSSYSELLVVLFQRVYGGKCSALCIGTSITITIYKVIKMLPWCRKSGFTVSSTIVWLSINNVSFCKYNNNNSTIHLQVCPVNCL